MLLMVGKVMVLGYQRKDPSVATPECLLRSEKQELPGVGWAERLEELRDAACSSSTHVEGISEQPLLAVVGLSTATQ